MPALQALHEELEDEGLVVFGVSVDRPGAREEVARFVHEHGIEFAVAVDGTFGVQQAFHTIGVPESFLIDRDGRIAFHWIGPFDPGEDAARAAVLAVLNR
jgi:peroxiredoxin